MLTQLQKINIEEYRKNHLQQHIIIKRISQTEGFIVACSYQKLSKQDLFDEYINQGFKPGSLEIIPALVPDISEETNNDPF